MTLPMNTSDKSTFHQGPWKFLHTIEESLPQIKHHLRRWSLSWMFNDTLLFPDLPMVEYRISLAPHSISISRYEYSDSTSLWVFSVLYQEQPPLSSIMTVKTCHQNLVEGWQEAMEKAIEYHKTPPPGYALSPESLKIAQYFERLLDQPDSGSKGVGTEP